MRPLPVDCWDWTEGLRAYASARAMDGIPPPGLIWGWGLKGLSCVRSVMAGQESPAFPGCGPSRSRSTRAKTVHSKEAAGGISEESPHMGSGQGQRGRCAGCRPIVTAAPTGPTSHNSDLRPNRSSRPLPTRSPRRASGQSTARLATFHTFSTGASPSSTADAL